jgi:hypothetical protein
MRILSYTLFVFLLFTSEIDAQPTSFWSEKYELNFSPSEEFIENQIEINGIGKFRNKGPEKYSSNCESILICAVVYYKERKVVIDLPNQTDTAPIEVIEVNWRRGNERMIIWIKNLYQDEFVLNNIIFINGFFLIDKLDSPFINKEKNLKTKPEWTIQIIDWERLRTNITFNDL